MYIHTYVYIYIYIITSRNINLFTALQIAGYAIAIHLSYDTISYSLKIFLRILSDLRTTLSISSLFPLLTYVKNSFPSLEPVPPSNLDVIVSLFIHSKLYGTLEGVFEVFRKWMPMFARCYTFIVFFLPFYPQRQIRSQKLQTSLRILLNWATNLPVSRLNLKLCEFFKFISGKKHLEIKKKNPNTGFA